MDMYMDIYCLRHTSRLRVVTFGSARPQFVGIKFHFPLLIHNVSHSFPFVPIVLLFILTRAHTFRPTPPKLFPLRARAEQPRP
jgi:hypothetical protein